MKLILTTTIIKMNIHNDIRKYNEKHGKNCKNYRRKFKMNRKIN